MPGSHIAPHARCYLGSGFKVQGIRFTGLGFKVQCARFKAAGFTCKVNVSGVVRPLSRP